MKKLLLGLGLLLLSGAALAANLPLINPATNPGMNEPSQLINSLNQVITQLNGGQGYAPAQVVSSGTFCTNGTAGGSPQICNGQRGAVLFTGITVAATGTNQTIVVTNSAVTTASNCTAQWNTAFTAGSGVVVGSVTPTAGSLSIVTVNAGTTTNAVTTGTLGINCFN